MYSNIALMDAQLGILIQELADENLLDSTIIVFFSDHGGPLPRHKRELYETGLRIPLIIRFPNKIAAGTVNEELVSFVDFGPTMLSLAGIEPPKYMQGQAFLGKYKKEPRQYIYGARDRMDSEYDMVRAVRDKNFKYLRNYKPELPFIQNIRYRKQIPMMSVLYKYDSLGLFEGVQKLWWRNSKPKEELYDIANDPYEFNNLANDPEYAEKLRELSTAMDNWQEKYGDKGFQDEQEMLYEMWDGEQKPVTKHVEIIQQEGQILMKCATTGASIAYQIGNNKHWELYTKPLDADNHKGEIIKAVAIRIGYKESKRREYKIL
jgi:arylsulfatase A-like enzyme